MSENQAAIDLVKAPVKYGGKFKAPSFETFKKKLFAEQGRLKPKLFDKGANTIKGQKVVLHHTKGRGTAELFNVVGVTGKQHKSIHAITGYKNVIWDKVRYKFTKWGIF